MKRDRLYELLSAYINEKICDEELDELIAYVNESEQDSDMYAVIDAVWQELKMDKEMPLVSDLVYQKITNDPRFKAFDPEIKASPKIVLWNTRKWLQIASVAAVFCVVLFLFFNKSFFTAHSDRLVVVPGGKKATLTLNNGKTIVLDDMAKGTIATENGTIIKKNSDGELIYEMVAEAKSNDGTDKQSLMNKITTPNGGEFQVLLPDGTRVWLNAASSLSFPAKFSEESREVSLIGEAYFEVTSKTHKGRGKLAGRIPFVVNTNNQRINVLGTKFNVKAYEEDKYSNTALIEGKVQISIPGITTVQNVTSRILKPGEKATIQHGDKNIEVGAFVKEEILAWKNGYFFFENENIRSVMTTIARWYDVDVSYQGNPESVFFDGTISRFDSIEKLLKTISLTGSVKFKLSERRLIVMI